MPGSMEESTSNPPDTDNNVRLPKSTNALLSEKYNLEPPRCTETTITRSTVVNQSR